MLPLQKWRVYETRYASLFLYFPVSCAGVVTSHVTPLKEFSFHRDANVGDDARIAFDRDFAYISSPDGQVYRTRGIWPDSPLKQVYAANTISNLVTHHDNLYVLVQTIDVREGEPLHHSLLQSRDHGESFTPVDEGLRACSHEYCQYLWATQLIVKNNLLFTNAGADLNLLVSPDQGDRWIALSGSVEARVCTHSAFEITGSTVLQGGECPLDRAFLRRGTLGPDKLGWAPGGDLKPVQSPDLENRNIMVIRAQPRSEVRLAGAEGAVLRSVDDGHSFSYAFQETQADKHYHYVQQILFPSRSESTPLIGGFDKVTGRPYLAISHDDGETWVDISHLLPGYEHYAVVGGLAENDRGEIIAVVTDFTARRVILARVKLDCTHERNAGSTQVH